MNINVRKRVGNSESISLIKGYLKEELNIVDIDDDTIENLDDSLSNIFTYIISMAENAALAEGRDSISQNDIRLAIKTCQVSESPISTDIDEIKIKEIGEKGNFPFDIILDSPFPRTEKEPEVEMGLLALDGKIAHGRHSIAYSDSLEGTLYSKEEVSVIRMLVSYMGNDGGRHRPQDLELISHVRSVNLIPLAPMLIAKAQTFILNKRTSSHILDIIELISYQAQEHSEMDKTPLLLLLLNMVQHETREDLLQRAISLFIIEINNLKRGSRLITEIIDILIRTIIGFIDLEIKKLKKEEILPRRNENLLYKDIKMTSGLGIKKESEIMSGAHVNSNGDTILMEGENGRNSNSNIVLDAYEGYNNQTSNRFINTDGNTSFVEINVEDMGYGAIETILLLFSGSLLKYNKETIGDLKYLAEKAQMFISFVADLREKEEEEEGEIPESSNIMLQSCKEILIMISERHLIDGS